MFSVDQVLLKIATRMKMKTMMIFMILLSVIHTGTARSWSWLPAAQDNETADIPVRLLLKQLKPRGYDLLLKQLISRYDLLLKTAKTQV
jgi:hypothetical protein